MYQKNRIYCKDLKICGFISFLIEKICGFVCFFFEKNCGFVEKP